MPTDVIRSIARHYRVTSGKDFRLKNVDPADTRGLELKDKAKELLEKGVKRMASLQEKLWAQDRWSVLFIFQALDAAGKDSAIEHVMSGLNPQGCEVHAFKAPTTDDLDHDYLWRVGKLLPSRGRIGIFNRSHYEEVLVVRVHPELLARQQLPPKLVTPQIWTERYKDIRSFERYATRQGIVIRKFFLHVSREEQKKRFLARIEEPEKNWKFSLRDVHEREHFGDYLRAFEDAIRATAAPWAPWYVVPADHKWFTRLVISSAVVETLESLNPRFPILDASKKKELEIARAALMAEDRKKRRKK